MTAAESPTQTDTPSSELRSRGVLGRPLLAWGTGVAVEITSETLELSMVRVRPGGAALLRSATITGFRERQAADWSTEYQQFVGKQQPSGITVVLPRRDVIVRHILLPGVPKRELAGALALRLRSLHPFADDDVAWCWTSLADGVLVGLTRLSVLSRYETLFEEAGIPVASFTFSAAVLNSALRLYEEPSKPFLLLSETGKNTFEAYGENAASAVFSGEFPTSAARASAAGIAELRLPIDFTATGLSPVLLQCTRALELHLPERPLAYAAAISAAVPLLLRTANFLPLERRAGQSRLWFIPTAVLALILIGVVGVLFAMNSIRQKRYAEALEAQITQLEPLAKRAAAVDRATNRARANIDLLNGFRSKAKGDFDVLNELTRILPPPTWANQVEIYPDYVMIGGQTPQAAPLLGILDASPLFHDSAFATSVSRNGKDEVFRIKALRRNK